MWGFGLFSNARGKFARMREAAGWVRSAFPNSCVRRQLWILRQAYSGKKLPDRILLESLRSNAKSSNSFTNTTGKGQHKQHRFNAFFLTASKQQYGHYRYRPQFRFVDFVLLRYGSNGFLSRWKFVPISLRRTLVSAESRRSYSSSSSSTSREQFFEDAAHSGFWTRLKLRIKLFLKGHPMRPWKVDDFLAMFTWIFMGQTVFVLAGTTTFVSLLLVLANSLQFQGYVAKRISDYLTRETGFNITFESAIVPNWREGTIRLKNVQVLCNADTWTELKREEKKAKGLGDLVDGEVDVNWTYWDLTIKSVDVTLSLWRWLEGRGLLKEAIMKGARGAVDRRHIWWDPNWKPARRNALPGDFELDRFVVEDLQISILNPGFRPYTVSIFNGELPLFRKQWLLYDMMCADSIVGTFDGCLFSVHKLQRDDTNKEHWDKVSNLKINNVPIAHFNQGVSGPFGWVTKGNLDIDLNVLIPQAPGDAIFSIIKDEFKDIKEKAMDKIEEVIRRHPNAKWGGEWRDRRDMRVDGDEDDDTDALAMVTAVTSRGPRSYGLQYAKRELPGIRSVETTDTGSDSSLALVATSPEDASQSGDLDQGPHAMDDETRPSFVMFGKVRMNNLKASVPLATNDISYISNAMIRPIVAYMNANRTSIPVTFAAKMDLANFDGAWTIYEAGLVDVLSEEVGQSLTQLVRDERERARQLKRVGLWSLQSVTKNLMVAVDYARGLRGWAHFTTLSEFGGPFHVAD